MRSKRTIGFFVLMTLLVALMPATLSAAPPGQGGSVYTVQKDDWLSKIADKVYGDLLAYPAIVYYNNLKAAGDDALATIDNPNLIEVGWTLYIPTADEATAFLSGEVGPLSLADKIANAVSAGPAVIAEETRVMEFPGGKRPQEAGEEWEQLVELRPGSNGWTCIPDNTDTPGNDPICLNEVYLY